MNLAYEAATADLNDVNMIDPFHLAAYGETTVNYNRDVEVFPVLRTIFESILGHQRMGGLHVIVPPIPLLADNQIHIMGGKALPGVRRKAL
mgnify:CR=1 FL=1